MLGRLHIVSNKKSFVRNISSVLYITADKAHKTYVVLTPIIDFDKTLEDKDLLIKNLKARNLKIDLEQLEKKWRFFQSVADRKNILELTRAEIGRSISELIRGEDTEKHEDELKTLKLHLKLVKDDLKNVKDYYYGLEEDTMLKILDLPNSLHNKTSSDAVTTYTYLDCSNTKSKCHLEIGEQTGYVEYINPFTYYFKSDAALFEMGILNYFRTQLMQSAFTKISGSNFCRSIIVEGCGDDYENSLKVLTLEEQEESTGDLNRLHLCGAASLYPFMAYFARHFVQQTLFPLKYFSVGKKYHSVSNTKSKDLFNLSQESVISIFVATVEEHDLLEEVTKLVISIYEPLGYHFKLVLLSASELEKSECLRLSIQMYSNYLEGYVEVGNVSLYDNYLSKRLLFTYNVNKEQKYPKVIAGTLLNVPKLLGCVLENNSVSKKELMTNLIKSNLFC